MSQTIALFVFRLYNFSIRVKGFAQKTTNRTVAVFTSIVRIFRYRPQLFATCHVWGLPALRMPQKQMQRRSERVIS